jgi:hypothetical protein
MGRKGENEIPRWAQEFGAETWERIGELLYDGWRPCDVRRELDLPSRTKRSLEECAKKYRHRRVLDCKCVRKCCVDASGLGMQLAEQAVERYGAYRVEGHTFTANLKEAMAGKLRVKMEGNALAIPADKRIRDDLHSIEKSVTVDGHIRLRAERVEGSHADRFWALALAVYAAADEAGPMEASFGPNLPFAPGAAW